jgi:hypothetical protein
MKMFEQISSTMGSQRDWVISMTAKLSVWNRPFNPQKENRLDGCFALKPDAAFALAIKLGGILIGRESST